MKEGRASESTGAAQLISSTRHYSSMVGRLSSQFSTSPSRQPIERVPRLPSFSGRGKSPLRTRRQIVVFDSPVSLTTSGVLKILSIAVSLPRALSSRAPVLLSDWKLLCYDDTRRKDFLPNRLIPSGASFHILAGRFILSSLSLHFPRRGALGLGRTYR